MSSLLHAKYIRPQLRRLLSDYHAEQKAIEKHAGETAVTWKLVSFLVGIPTCGFLFYKNFIAGEHEGEHHEYVPYEHIRIRKVQFPWGSESLFHSKHNYSPDSSHHDEVGDTEEKENFITAFIRRKIEEQVKADWKMQMEFVRDTHQSMLEHIERKKFTSYPHLPRYSRMFTHPNPTADFHDPKARLPNSFDD